MVFGLACALACRPTASVRPARAAELSPKPQENPAPGSPRLEPLGLGPGDAELAPLGRPKPIELGPRSVGPKLIYGRGLRGRRPNAPGRSGALHIAVDTPYQVFGRGESYVHVAAWRRGGKPAAGARVYIGRSPLGRTDATGTLVARYSPPPERSADEPWQTGSLFVVDGGRCGAVEFEPFSRTPTFASDHLFVYTDRGVYSPGDTLHTRLIGWRLQEDYGPLESASWNYPEKMDGFQAATFAA